MVGNEKKEGAVERFTALSISQPMASLLCVPSWEDREGKAHAARSIFIDTERCGMVEPCGELLICSRLDSDGETIGLVDFYAVKKTDDFTPEDWKAAGVHPGELSGWGYFFRNPRRVIEIPVRKDYNFEQAEFPEGEIMEYPRVLRLGADGYRKLTGR